MRAGASHRGMGLPRISSGTPSATLLTLAKVPLRQAELLLQKTPTLSTSSVVLRVSWAGVGAAAGFTQECFGGALG